MIDETAKERFRREGFLVVPGVLSESQVAGLRELLIEKFDSGPEKSTDTPTLRADLCARYPETRYLLWHGPIVETLRALLGDDFVYLPEMSAHASFFSDWHKDTQSQELAGHDFHWRDDFLMVEAALYLQDNDDHGGGLDVVPGSHNQPARTRWERLRTWLRRKRPHSIRSKAGDLVIFDFRCDHRATRPKLGRRARTGEDRKLAIFFACSANNAHVREYLEFLRSYDGAKWILDYEYPEDLLQEADRRALKLADV